MVILRALPVFFGLALLAGCAAVGPNYQLPAKAIVNAPAAQGPFVSGSAATSVDQLPDHWWQLYADQTLDDLIQRALAANTDLRIAEANLRRSGALLAEVRTRGEITPTADLETSFAQRSAEAELQHVQPPERPIYNIGLGISYDLDLFGGIRRGIEAANADQEVAVAARDLVRINVVAETARAYAEICSGGHEASVLQTLIVTQQDALELDRKLVTYGRAAPFELDRQKSGIEATRARLPQLEARRRNAAFRLATLMGLPPAQFDASLLDCQRPLQLTRPLPVGDGQALLKRRPDIRAAERRLAAATARIGVSTAALYPDIRLGASIGSTGSAADLFSSLTNRFGIGPMISWDLHRSAVRTRIEQSEAQSQAALAAFDGTVLRALREVEIAIDNYSADLDRLNRLKAARDATASVAAKTLQMRLGGKVGSLVALDAERNRVIADQAVAAAFSDISDDQIAIFLALGGGWT